MRPHKSNAGQRGQATIEFVLTLPVLILIVLAIFDFGRAIWYFNTLAQAAREGTRYAMVHGSASPSPVGPGAPSYTAPDRDTTVEDVVRRFGFGMDPSQITTLSTWPDGDNRAGHRVRVEARYPYVPLTTMIVGGASITLRSTSVATIQY